MIAKLGRMMGKVDLTYILLPRNATAAAPIVDKALVGGSGSDHRREVKSLNIDNVMAVTEEPYITDLDLESFLNDVTDNALELVTTTELGDGGATAVEMATEGHVLLANTTMAALDLTLAASDLPAEEEGSGLLQLDMTSMSTQDFTGNILDLLSGTNDLLSNGLELLNDNMDRIDNVHAIFPDHTVTFPTAANLTEDFTQSVLFVTMPHHQNDGNEDDRDFTDNVLKMLFHADEIDGWLELAGGEEANCSVFNVTEAAVEARYSLDQEVYLGELVLLASLCIPASLAVIIYILSDSSRWTGVNSIICWSRLVSLACLILPISKVVMHRELLCISLHLLLPALVLHEKVCLSSAAVLRFFYIFRPNCMNSTPSVLLFLLIVLPAVAAIAAPYATLALEYPPLYSICLGQEAKSTATIYIFLFAFMVVWFNSLLVDIFCYVRIINYMRLLKMRVNIAPDTDEEMRKMINIINGPSSLLIWLVSCVSMLPTLILQYRTSWRWEYEEERMAGHYHAITIFTLNLVVPLMLVGSSLEMRNKIRYLQTRIEKFAHRTFGIGREEPRADTYAVPNANRRNPA